MTKRHRKAPTTAPNNNRTSATNPAPTSTFSDHVRELRRRIIWVALVFAVASALAYNYHDFLVQLVIAPLGHQKLVYLTPGGGFGFIFQITMLAGAVASAPVLMYNLYRFVMPALPKHARRHTIKIFFASILLLIAGISFGYFIAVPAALNFLTTFADSYVTASLTTDSYLNFIISYLLGLGLIFQLPLLLIFWHWIKPLTPTGLLKGERLVILFGFIAAAIITPTPDMVNQTIIAIPIIAVYQLGVVAVLIMIYRKRKAEKKAQLQTATVPVSRPVFSPPPPVVEPPRTTTLPPQVVSRPRPRPRSIEGFMPLKQPLAVSSAARRTPRTSLLQKNVAPSPVRGHIRPPARPMSVDGLSYLRPKA